MTAPLVRSSLFPQRVRKLPGKESSQGTKVPGLFIPGEQKFPGNESSRSFRSLRGTFVPGNEKSWERKVRNSVFLLALSCDIVFVKQEHTTTGSRDETNLFHDDDISTSSDWDIDVFNVQFCSLIGLLSIHFEVLCIVTRP